MPYDTWHALLLQALQQIGWTEDMLHQNTMVGLFMLQGIGKGNLLTDFSYGQDIISGFQHTNPGVGLHYSTAIQINMDPALAYNSDHTHYYFGTPIAYGNNIYDWVNGTVGYSVSNNVGPWTQNGNSIVPYNGAYPTTNQLPSSGTPANSGDALLLQRLQELLSQGSNNFSQQGLESLQAEITQLTNNLTQITNSTVLTLQRLGEIASQGPSQLGQGSSDTLQAEINNLQNELTQAQDTTALNLQRIQELVSQGAQNFSQQGFQALNNTIQLLTQQLDANAAQIPQAITAQTQAQSQAANEINQGIKEAAIALLTPFEPLIQTLTGLSKDKVDLLIQMLAQQLTTAFDTAGKGLVDAAKTEVIGLETFIMPFIQGIGQQLKIDGDKFNKLMSGGYATLDDFYADVSSNLGGVNVLSALQNGVTLVLSIMTFATAKLIPLRIALEQSELSQFKPVVNDIQSVVNGYLKGILPQDKLFSELALHGLNDERVKDLINSRTELLPLEYVRTAFQRGVISQQQHDQILYNYAFPPDTTALIRQLYELLPSPTDITRIADKHIFSADIASSFGQYSEIDQGYIDAMAKWGISEDWVKRLWASHWSLPGLQNIFDLWHRGLITDEQKDTYFKLTDILPFFRDKLTDLSYNLLTRVDVRRLHQLHIITDQQLYQEYIKQGYSPDNARQLTDFTVLHDNQSDIPSKVKIRELTQSLVIKGLKEGFISFDQAVSRLINLGYADADARLIVEIETQLSTTGILADKTQHYHDKAVALLLSDYSKGVISRDDVKGYLLGLGVDSGQVDLELYYAEIERITVIKSKIIASVSAGYTKGHITKTEATQLMLGSGFGMSEVTLLFEELDIELMVRSKELTLAQLDKFLTNQVITIKDYQQELKNLGYSDLHIGWLVTQATGV